MRLRFTTRLSEDITRPTHYKTNLKQGAHIHQPTAWSVPHARVQPYHPAKAVMDSCFALIGAHQRGNNSMAVIVLSLSRIKMSKIQVNRQWRQSACSVRDSGRARSANWRARERKRNLPSSRSSLPLKILLIINELIIFKNESVKLMFTRNDSQRLFLAFRCWNNISGIRNNVTTML